MKFKDFAYLTGIIILIVLLLQQRCSNRAEINEWMHVNDTLTHSVDKYGKRIASMRVASGVRKNAIKRLQASKDSLNIRLANEIKKRGTSSATVINTVTEIHRTDTSYITSHDTFIVVNNDTVRIRPVYETEYEDKWIKFDIRASHDSIVTNQYFKNSLVMRYHRKRGSTIIEVQNKNPYTDTQAVRSWTVKRKPKRWGVGIHAGVGVDSDLNVNAQVGVSLQYRFISF